jgi:hypothetical protein
MTGIVGDSRQNGPRQQQYRTDITCYDEEKHVLCSVLFLKEFTLLCTGELGDHDVIDFFEDTSKTGYPTNTVL